MAGTIALVLVLGAGLATVFVKQMKRVADEGWTMLSVAQSLAASGRANEALQALTQVESRYGNSKITDFALTQQANLYIRGNIPAQAIEAYQKVLNRGKVQELIPIAQLGLGKAYEASAELDKAQQQYQTFLNSYPEHFSAPEAYEGMARVSEMKGDLGKAKENLERLRALYPDTIWAKHATEKLKSLASSR